MAKRTLVSSTVGLCVLIAAAACTVSPDTQRRGSLRSGLSTDITVAAIGDSISVSANSNDNCDNIIACSKQLGDDTGYSWTTGDQTSASFLSRYKVAGLNVKAVVREQINGKRLDDAPRQAQNIVDNVKASGAENVKVTMELGGNDVCRPVDGALPDLATLEGFMTKTFSILSAGLPVGSEVLVVGVPDIGLLRTLMKSEPHFLWKTCQDLWDQNSTYAPKVCTMVGGLRVCLPPSLLAGPIGLVVEAFKLVVKSTSGGFNFPCGIVLNSGTTEAKRSAALLLNEDINTSLATKVAAADDPEGVRFFFFDLSTYSFTTSDVSHLDCFHPSRAGQAHIAEAAWNAFYGP